MPSGDRAVDPPLTLCAAPHQLPGPQLLRRYIERQSGRPCSARPDGSERYRGAGVPEQVASYCTRCFTGASARTSNFCNEGNVQMTRPEKRILSLAVALVTGLWVVPAAATNIVGSKLQAKPTIKFQFQSKDPAITPAGINPIADGATLTVVIGAVTLTFNMPGGAVCGGVNCWSGDTTAGWRYKNSAAPGAPGVVKIAQIKAGKMKVLTKGSSGDAGGAFP